MDEVSNHIDDALDKLNKGHVKDVDNESYSSSSKSFFNQKSMIHALLVGLLAALVFSPYAFNLTNQLSSKAGLELVSYGGAPTIQGIGVHALIVVAGVMLLNHFGY